MGPANFSNLSSNFQVFAGMLSNESLPPHVIVELSYAIEACYKQSGDQSVAIEERSSDAGEPAAASSSASLIAPRLALTAGGLFFEALLIGFLCLFGIAGNLLSFLVLRLGTHPLVYSVLRALVF